MALASSSSEIPLLGSRTDNDDRFNERKVSSSIRTFFLFIVFDVILIFILWVSYTQLLDQSHKAFTSQVVEYTFRTSLFDTVLLSLVRFICLAIAYVVIRIKHWIVIAFTTTASCGLIIAKVFLFHFSSTHGTTDTLSYCLIIISFVLAWTETWYLDFKLLKYSKKNRVPTLQDPGNDTDYISDSSSEDEVTSEVHTNLGYHREDTLQLVREDDGMSTVTAASNAYFTPYGSPTGSDDETAHFQECDVRSYNHIPHQNNIDIEQNHTDIEQNHTDIEQNHTCTEQNHIGIKQNHTGKEQNHNGIEQNHTRIEQNFIGIEQNHTDIAKQNHIDIEQNNINIEQNHREIDQYHNGVDQKHVEFEASLKSVEEVHPWHDVAQKNWKLVWSYHTSPEDQWKHEKGLAKETGIVHSRKVRDIGKVFRLQGVVDINPKLLFEDMVFKPEEGCTWNPVMKESQILQVIDSRTDILYTVAHEIAGGLISSRDFVALRYWGHESEVYFVAGESVEHSSKPPCKQHVRAINGPGGWIFQSVPLHEDKCLFFWYMITDMKGWFPQKLIDANMANVQLDFLSHLHGHVKDMKSDQKP